MRLYDLIRGDRFVLREDAKGPPGAADPVFGEIYTFQKVDGMYASCVDQFGTVVFVPAYSDVELV